MLSEEDLRDKARKDCLEHVRQVLRGEMDVELGASEISWSLTDLRHVFDQPMVIWRLAGGFEIVLDETNRAVGFVDPDKWQDCQWQPLAEADIRQLVDATGMVGKGYSVEDVHRGDRECLEATLAEGGPQKVARRFTVRVNPARRAIISLEPEQPEKEQTGEGTSK